MQREQEAPGAVLRDLGGGLVVRRSSRDDMEALATFNAQVFGSPESGPDMSAAGWVRDLIGGNHPTFKQDDFLLVEDTAKKTIASSLCMISQTWSYDGVEFGVGRPEIVGTMNEYRRRGLVRALFDELHRLSAGRGEMVQAITGIMWYYRQFGYEFALDLSGGRIGYKSQAPRLKEDQTEPYILAPATVEHSAFITRLYAQAAARYRMVTVFDDELWRYELTERSDDSDTRAIWRVIHDADGQLVGALRHENRARSGGLALDFYELMPGFSFGAVTPSVLRYLQAQGEAYSGSGDTPWNEYRFSLGLDHPAYAATPALLPVIRRPYAWYMRVPDLPAFVTHIAPALERRLAASPLSGHSGELSLNFFTSGLRLAFQDGRLTGATSWRSEYVQDGDASFPDLTFLQLLFGYRRLDELEYAFPDCRVKGDGPRSLLNALFPRQQSHALGIV